MEIEIDTQGLGRREGDGLTNHHWVLYHLLLTTVFVFFHETKLTVFGILRIAKFRRHEMVEVTLTLIYRMGTRDCSQRLFASNLAEVLVLYRKRSCYRRRQHADYVSH